MNQQNNFLIDSGTQDGAKRGWSGARDVEPNVEPELPKDNGVDVVLLIGEGSDENIMEMDLAMMEQQSLGDASGEMEGLQMEVFNEVVLEEILQVLSCNSTSHIGLMPLRHI